MNVSRILFAVLVTSLAAVFFGGLGIAIGDRWSFVSENNPVDGSGKTEFFFGPVTWCRKITEAEESSPFPNGLTCYDWEEPTTPLTEEQGSVRDHMRSAWGFAIVVGIMSFLSALVSGILAYTSGSVNRTIFIVLNVLTGLSFLCGIVSMGLSTAANNLAGKTLGPLGFQNTSFVYSVGWYFNTFALCFATLAFIGAIALLVMLHRGGAAAAPARPVSTGAASPKMPKNKTTSNPLDGVKDFE